VSAVVHVKLQRDDSSTRWQAKDTRTAVAFSSSFALDARDIIGLECEDGSYVHFRTGQIQYVRVVVED